MLMTPEFRVSYANVFTPQKNDLNGKMEFSIVALFAPGADLSALKKHCFEVGVKKFGEKNMADPDFKTKLKLPFRKAEERWKKAEDGAVIVPPGYEAGVMFITLKSEMRPGLVDANVQDIIEQSQFYSGCYAQATVNAYAYDQKGNKGIALGLGNIQKLRDGDSLGTRTRPQDDFKPVAGTPAAATAGDPFA